MQKSKLQSMGRGDREHLERTSEELHQHRSLLCRLLVLRRRPFLCCCRRRPLPSVAFDGLCAGGLPSVSCRRAAVREAEAERREAGGAGARATSRGWEADWIGDASQVSCRRFCRRLPLGPAGSFPRFSVPARASFPRRYSRSGQHHYFPLPAVPPQRRALPRSSSCAVFQRQDAFFPDSVPFNRCDAFRRTPRRAQRLNERIPLKRNVRVKFSV